MLILITCAAPGRCEEPMAFEQLLVLFEKKGVLTTDEAETLRKAYIRERKPFLGITASPDEKLPELTAEESMRSSPEDSAIDAADAPLEFIAPDSELLWKGTAYEDGFCIAAGDKYFETLCLEGLLQADYRAFDYPGDDPARDKFDIRRARLGLHGKLTDLFSYKFEYEFEGAGSRRLLDAYLDINLTPQISFRLGQFKEPFGLEQLTSDKYLFFAERSMGFYLTPGRDVGLMAYGAVPGIPVWYGLGLFNGDGYDDATGGDEDALEITSRIFTESRFPDSFGFIDQLHAGFSASYARIDRNNVNLKVKTTGLTNFFQVASSAKFNIIRDAANRVRTSFDLGASFGRLAVWGERFYMKFQEIETGANKFSFDLTDTYGAALFMLTGENVGFTGGKIDSIEPEKPVGREIGRAHV